MAKVRTCLWFGKDAEATIPFYVSIVPDSRLDHIQRSPAAWPGAEAGDVIVISFPVTEIIWGRNDRPDAIREHELPF
jgi:predicted 3-demethylubiquinone-9 3-methyltransferase (glyoxalase superfamily)